MGFSISWVAFWALSRMEVLGRAGLRASLHPRTETHDMGTPRSPFSLAEIPTGWTILFSEFPSCVCGAPRGSFRGRCRNRLTGRGARNVQRGSLLYGFPRVLMEEHTPR